MPDFESFKNILYEIKESNNNFADLLNQVMSERFNRDLQQDLFKSDPFIEEIRRKRPLRTRFQRFTAPIRHHFWDWSERFSLAWKALKGVPLREDDD